MFEICSDSYRWKAERELDLRPSTLRLCPRETVVPQGWRWPGRTASSAAAASWAGAAVGELAGPRLS